MNEAALEANPAALALLALVQQGATGALSFAGRTLRLSQGDVVAVGASGDDEPLWEFIRRSERISGPQLDALLADSLGDADPSVADDDVERRLRSVLQSWDGAEDHRVGPLIRACYLERLVRCLRVPNANPTRLKPPADGEEPDPGPRITTLNLLLDALARVALEQDAAIVGAELRARLQWLPGPFAAQARRWAALGDAMEESTLAAILAKRPASVPPIAALVRAGLARLMSPPPAARAIDSRKDTLPPPAPRLTALPEDDAEPICTATLSDFPRLRLEPGLAEVSAEPFLPVRPPPLRARDPELVDPLRALELEIEELERSEGNGVALAARWEAIADLWEHRLDCPEEAMRALREAAAAFPFSARLLQRTAVACAVTGHHALSVEYALAAISVADTEAEQRSAELFASELRLRRFDCVGALEHLRRAADLTSESGPDAEVLERIAVLTRDQGAPAEEVAQAFVDAASALSKHPGRACALWSVAYELDPSEPSTVLAFSATLAATDSPQAGLAIQHWYAVQTNDTEARAALLLDAASRAELAGQGLFGLQCLLDAFSLRPSAEVTHGPLAAHLYLETLDDAERVAVSQDLANHCAKGQRTEFLVKAGAAALACPGEGELGRLLLQAALSEGASEQAVRELLGELPEAKPPALDALIPGVRKRAEDTEDPHEQALLYRRLAGLEHTRNNTRGTVSAALRCLAISPRDTVAAARLLRCASLLGESTILREALHYAARAATDERRRALHLSALALQLERNGDLNEALECAESAMRDNRHAGTAALLILRHHARLPAARALPLLRKALALFPDLPPQLDMLAQAARRAGDITTASDALSRWSDASPFDATPRRLRLELDLASPDSARLLLSARSLLEVIQRHEHLVAITNACSRAAEQGDLAGASSLLQDLQQQVGSRDPLLAERALEFARLSADAQLVGSALEHLVQCQEGKERARTLALIAEQHRRRGDAVAELRARLRVLAEAGYDPDSVDRLTDLFAAAGDGKRLGAVLTLALQSVRTQPERRSLWIRMACARAELSADHDGMLRHISALLAEQARDALTVRDAVGIALHLSPSVAVGVRAVFELTDRLPSEIGARIALGLVKTAQDVLKNPQLAVELSAEGAMRFPLCGELLLLFETLALQAHDANAAKQTYDALIERAAGKQGRRALHYRAGRFLERLNREQEALDRYLTALELAPAPGTILVSIERVAENLKRYDALRDAYCMIARQTPDEATRHRFAKWAYALSRKHDPDRAMAIAAEFDVRPPGSDELRSTASFAAPRNAVPSPKPLRPAPWERLPAAPGDTQPGLSAEGPKLSEQALRNAAKDGSLESQAALAQFLKQQGKLEEAHSLFLHIVKGDPGRTDAIRGLFHTAKQIGASAVRHVCEQWLALFDDTLASPPPCPFRPEHWTSDELSRLLRGDLAPDVQRVLGLLWQSARSIPDLLAPLERYGVSARDLALAHNCPRIIAVVDRLAKELGVPRPSAIYARSEGDAIGVAALQPAAILLPKALEQSADLEAALAYALVIAAPAHAMVLAPDRVIVDHVLGGLLAAFGPASAVASASLHDKVMAATLWDVVPMREQDFVRRTVDKHLHMFQPESLRQRAELAGLRAALLVAGDPRPALRLLRERTKFPSDGDFSYACAERPMLTELVRTSLSDAYLAAVGRSL